MVVFLVVTASTNTATITAAPAANTASFLYSVGTLSTKNNFTPNTIVAAVIPVNSIATNTSVKKHFIKMLKDVGMVVPKSKGTRL